MKNFRAPAVDRERKKELNLFEKYAGIRFKSLELLNLAFSHRSFSNEQSSETDNNEKLEFLGDSILGLVVSEYIFNSLPDKNEGELAKIKSFVVSEDSLDIIGRKIRIDNFVLIGKGEEYSGGRTKKAIIADCLEAVFGAYFIDSGFKPAKKFVLQCLTPEINKVLEDRHRKDYKTLLQELVQKKYKTYPKYSLINKKGPDHDKTFWIEVKFNEQRYGVGKGKSKKEAEQNAAAEAWNKLEASGLEK
jgi:ribonuclease-3